jgi:hypothetical protein
LTATVDFRCAELKALSPLEDSLGLGPLVILDTRSVSSLSTLIETGGGSNLPTQIPYALLKTDCVHFRALLPFVFSPWFLFVSSNSGKKKKKGGNCGTLDHLATTARVTQQHFLVRPNELDLAWQDTSWDLC